MDVTKSHFSLSWSLTRRQLCDLELLMLGAFDPLDSFMSQADYLSVLKNTRLASGAVWPMPIVLDLPKLQADKFEHGSVISLCGPEGHIYAQMTVREKWMPDKTVEAMSVFGTADKKHPGVAYLFDQSGDTYISGPLAPVALPCHYDFVQDRFTPQQLKAYFQNAGYHKVVAFQTRNPMHRAHQELTVRAANALGAHLLIHPVVGQTKPNDIDHFTRVRCYKKLLSRYPEGSATLSLLPLAMRMGGPREALWHALIRKNYGCTHFIVGRDHAGPGVDSQGKPFYDPYAAQDLVKAHQSEIGIEMVPFQEVVYVKERQAYSPENELALGESALRISGTQLRDALRTGAELPDWFSYPDIMEELRKTHPQRAKQGFVIFFTGLSGAGKSTIANALMARLMEWGNRSITLLDGDIVRQHLSSELGFSKEHRDLNVRRIGFVASEIAKAGGLVVTAAIAPYQAVRNEVRDLVSAQGGFIEIYVSTSLQVCQKRDPKGLYGKVKAGLLKGFTGIDDPYEVPENPEMNIDTATCSVSDAVERIITQLSDMGYLEAPEAPAIPAVAVEAFA